MKAKPRSFSVSRVVNPGEADLPLFRMIYFLKTRFRGKDHAAVALNYHEAQKVIEQQYYHESLFQSFYPTIR